MSFISVLKKIGGVALTLEHVASPLVSLAVPGARPVLAVLDPIFARLQTTAQTLELNDPRDGQGGIKAQAVTADFEEGLALTQSILAAAKQKLVYDDAALQRGLASQIDAYNAFAEVKASFKVVPI